MCSPTVERRHIIVKSAGAHLANQELWNPTSAFTLEKSHTSVPNAVTQVLIPLISDDTWPNIQQQLTSFGLAIVWRSQCLILIANSHKCPQCSYSILYSHITKHPTAAKSWSSPTSIWWRLKWITKGNCHVRGKCSFSCASSSSLKRHMAKHSTEN